MFGTEIGQSLSIDPKGANPFEYRNRKPIMAEGLPKHVEIETKSIVGDNALTSDVRFHLRPNPGKRRGIGRIARRNAVDLGEIEPVVVIGRLNQQTQLVDDYSGLDANEPYLADARPGMLRSLEVNCCKCETHEMGKSIRLPRLQGAYETPSRGGRLWESRIHSEPD